MLGQGGLFRNNLINERSDLNIDKISRIRCIINKQKVIYMYRTWLLKRKFVHDK